MKKALVLSLIAALLFSFETDDRPVVAASGKHALIVAIGAYDVNATGWGQISSVNDVPLIKGSLLRLGFPESNITTLLDEKADRKGILEALSALEKKAMPGDMVVIHISSHGQQITDDASSDEVDGYDEAIVGFGAPVSDRVYKSRGGRGLYDGSLHLRDDELGAMIQQIRAKIGTKGHVLTILDACHSGSGTRGTAKVRGGEPPFDIDPAKKPSPSKNEDGGFGIMGEGTKSRGEEDKSKLGRHVVISGASAHELNYETADDNGNSVGSLSYCLSKVLNGMPARTTYRAMFARVLSEMANKAPRQTPQIEGDIDSEIFENNFVPQAQYFSVTAITSPNTIKINAGKLMNIFEGTPIAIEKAGATAASKAPLSTGKVTSVTNFDAVVTLDKNITVKNKVDVWAFQTGAVLPEKPIRVNIENIADKTFKSAMVRAISEMKIAQMVKEESDLTIGDTGLMEQTRGTPSPTNQLNIFASAFGSPLGNKQIPVTAVDAGVQYFADMIKNYSQGKMFLDLDLEEPGFPVKITRILPVRSGSRSMNDIVDVAEYMDKGNMINIPAGSHIFVELKNYGLDVSYFNIIDIEPSGKINPLLPVVRNNTVVPELQSLKLQPGETKIIAYPIKISPPYGIEIFKVISTGMPFDLGSTIVVPGYRTRGPNDVRPQSTIEKLLGESFEITSSRGADLDQSEMGTSTHEFAFKIVEK